MQSVIFAILAGITLGSALMVVTSRNLLHSALWLIASFFGIAGIFILLQAEFLAVVQVLIYIGAIAMLIIFAIMLTRRIMDPQQPRFNSQWGLVGGFAALLFVGLAAVVTRVACLWRWARFPPTQSRNSASTSWVSTRCRSRSHRYCWSSP
jgi:NADH:ubiquinone oxidoreductase subunit 6 (subunit J)